MCGLSCLSPGLASVQLGRYGLEEKDFDFSAERVTASVHESLERLGLEYLDIVQAHDVEFGSLDQVPCLRIVKLQCVIEEGASLNLRVWLLGSLHQ